MNKKGFSLVELLVVVGIMMILISSGIFYAMKIRDRARLGKVVEMVRTYAVAGTKCLGDGGLVTNLNTDTGQGLGMAVCNIPGSDFWPKDSLVEEIFRMRAYSYWYDVGGKNVIGFSIYAYHVTDPNCSVRYGMVEGDTKVVNNCTYKFGGRW